MWSHVHWSNDSHPSWGIPSWMMKNTFFLKECQEQGAKKEPGKVNQVLSALSHSSDGCTLLRIYMFYIYVLLLIKVDTIFNQQDSTLLPGSVWEDLLYSTLPWVQSEDWASRTIQGLSVNPHLAYRYFIGCNVKTVQPIWGLLSKVWIQGLCRTILVALFVGPPGGGIVSSYLSNCHNIDWLQSCYQKKKKQEGPTCR